MIGKERDGEGQYIQSFTLKRSVIERERENEREKMRERERERGMRERK